MAQIRIESDTAFVVADELKYFTLDFQEIPLAATITDVSVTILTNRTNYQGLDCVADLYYSIQRDEVLPLTKGNLMPLLEDGERRIKCSYSVRNLRLTNFDEWYNAKYGASISSTERLQKDATRLKVLNTLAFSFKVIIDVTYEYEEHTPKSKAYYLYGVNRGGLSAIDCAIFYFRRKVTYDPFTVGGEWLRCSLMIYKDGEWHEIYKN